MCRYGLWCNKELEILSILDGINVLVFFVIRDENDIVFVMDLK